MKATTKAALMQLRGNEKNALCSLYEALNSEEDAARNPFTSKATDAVLNILVNEIILPVRGLDAGLAADLEEVVVNHLVRTVEQHAFEVGFASGFETAIKTVFR